MMNTASLACSLALLASACATDDGAASPADLDCTQERLGMAGAFEVDTPSIAIVTREGQVIGVGGFGAVSPGSPPTTSYALSVRNPLVGELQTVGPHDVAATNLKYLLAPRSADCQMPGLCSGFVAVAGTYEVLETQPRYRASFVLAQLHAYDGSSSDLGAAIAGEVHGCVHAAGN